MDRPADTTVYRLLHRVLLSSIERLAATVAEAADAGQRRALARWTAGLTDTIRWHHDEEEHHAFPALVEASPAGAPLIERLTADDRALTELLDRVDAAFSPLDDPGHAAYAVGELLELFKTHIEDEDVNIAPLLERHLTFEEFARQQAAAARRLPLRTACWTVPWMLTSCSRQEQLMVLAVSSPTLRIIGSVATPAYRQLERTAGLRA
jgi:hemerythrin HHE cation binding domain-containing protein